MKRIKIERSKLLEFPELKTSRIPGFYRLPVEQRLAYLARSFGEFSWEKEQLKGYRQALKDAGIPFDRELAVEIKRLEIGRGYDSVKELFKKSIDFTGLICANNIVCIGATNAIKEKGLKVPEDINMICIGESSEVTMLINDYEEMGRVAVKRLLERLTNPDWQPERTVVMNKLLVLNSTLTPKESTLPA